VVTDNRRGVALPLVLLLLLALTGLANGALVLSRRELQATWSQRHIARATQALEIARRLASAVPLDAVEARTPWEARPLVEGETPDGLVYAASRRWLDPEFYLLEVRGGSRGWEGMREAIWVGWSVHPSARARAFLSVDPGEVTGAGEEGRQEGS